MQKLRMVLIGVSTDPLVVAAARALLFYVVPVALAASVAYVQGWTDPRLVPLVPFLVALIRATEGAIDRAKKPAMNQINPPPVAGSGGPNPAG